MLAINAPYTDTTDGFDMQTCCACNTSAHYYPRSANMGDGCAQRTCASVVAAGGYCPTTGSLTATLNQANAMETNISVLHCCDPGADQYFVFTSSSTCLNQMTCNTSSHFTVNKYTCTNTDGAGKDYDCWGHGMAYDTAQADSAKGPDCCSCDTANGWEAKGDTCVQPKCGFDYDYLLGATTTDTVTVGSEERKTFPCSAYNGELNQAAANLVIGDITGDVYKACCVPEPGYFVSSSSEATSFSPYTCTDIDGQDTDFTCGPNSAVKASPDNTVA